MCKACNSLITKIFNNDNNFWQITHYTVVPLMLHILSDLYIEEEKYVNVSLELLM
jgi:hypothetical protein